MNTSGTRGNDPGDYTEVDKILTESVVLADAHFHLDKTCQKLGIQRTHLDAICNRTDTPAAIPTRDLPFKAVTCYMLNDNGMGYSMGQLLKMYRLFNKNYNIKLNFCYHPAQASLLDTPTKKYEAVEMRAEHLVMPGNVAASEFGFDLHRNKKPEARHHSREVLSQKAKSWLRTLASKTSLWFFMSMRSMMLTKKPPTRGFPLCVWPLSMTFARFISIVLLVLLRHLYFGLAIFNMSSLVFVRE